MKNILSILIAVLPFAVNAQTMKWVPSQSVKQHLLCYSLEYTPNVSGVLTSYTTAFFISCTSAGSAVVKNESVAMTDNVNLIDGCLLNHMVLMNSSGNSGSGTNNTVSAGAPVILHQVCFSIPNGESITIREDQTTDLTTSIDLVSGGSVTEYPDFAEMIVHKQKPHISKPLWLDFKTVVAGNFVTQLDWTTSDESNNSHFFIERSLDGKDFTAIGRIDAVSNPGRINSYQYLDKAGVLGKNFYRLQQVNAEGKVTYSPIREVNFYEKAFSVVVSPNPADQFLLVDIQSPMSESTIKLIDPSGRVVIDEKNDNNLLKTRLDIEKLPSGRYMLVVETTKHKFTENIVVVH